MKLTHCCLVMALGIVSATAASADTLTPSTTTLPKGYVLAKPGQTNASNSNSCGPCIDQTGQTIQNHYYGLVDGTPMCIPCGS